jgi:L-aminopeptidase/D-esterase-like protein
LATTAFNDAHNPADDGVVGVGTGAQSGAIARGWFSQSSLTADQAVGICV